MGLNLIIGCTKHKARIWIFRGEENEAARFYREHWQCAKDGSVLIGDDQTSLPWLEDPTWAESVVPEESNA